MLLNCPIVHLILPPEVPCLGERIYVPDRLISPTLLPRALSPIALVMILIVPLQVTLVILLIKVLILLTPTASLLNPRLRVVSRLPRPKRTQLRPLRHV